jgi:hypothetical protein
MNLPDPLPTGGVKIPIYATFTEVKGVPLWVHVTNSASPLLCLHTDFIEFKVLRRHLKPFHFGAARGRDVRSFGQQHHA